MRYRLFPDLIGILVVLLSLALLAWGVWPVGLSTRQARLRIPGEDTSMEAHNIELSWPAWLRAGDSGVIRLVLESGDKPADAGSETNRLVESRLEAAGLQAVPAGEILEPLLPGRQAVFYWRVLPERSGEIDAVVWVRLQPQHGESSKSGNQALGESQLLTAQKIPIKSINLYGLDGRMARLLGGIGVVVGLALCLDGYLLKKRIWKEVGNDHA